MAINDPSQLFDMPLAELDPIAGKVLGENAICFGELSIKPIGRSFGLGTEGIYHVKGHARISVGEVAWSAVAKVLGAPKALFEDDDLEHQIEVYRSGAFAELCGGIRSAHCHAIQERDDSQILWLEDLTGAPQTPWLPQYYLQCARHIGQFNAHWPEQSLPEWQWLQKGSISKQRSPWLQQRLEQLPTRQYEPLFRRLTSPDVTRRLLDFWERSSVIFDQAELTTKGVCHLDCHPKNLFPMGSTPQESFTVAIDWMAVGIGFLGIDVGQMLISPIKWLDLAPQQARLLIEPVFDAYLIGLKESGWVGNEDQIRLTYMTVLACESFRAIGAAFGMVDDATVRRMAEKNLGLPIEEIFDRWVDPMLFFLECVDKTILLANKLRATNAHP